MKTIKVPDMHCEKCVERISNALTLKNIDFKINLENKTITAEESKSDIIKKILDYLGFDAE